MVSLAPAATLRAAIYARVSTAGQAEDGYGLDGQVSECLALAERIGATVLADHVYREVGSGADWNLPMLMDLLDRAKHREIDAVIALATSRLARDVGKMAVLQRTLDRAGVAVRYVHHQFDDSPSGDLTQNVLAAIDSYERKNIALRFAMGKRQKLALNLVMGGGQTPYGWRRIQEERGTRRRTIGYEHDPAEAAVIRRFRELLTISTETLCNMLNAEGIPSPGKWRPSEKRRRCGQWGISSIHSVLKNPMTWGEYHYRQAEPVTIQLDPILTRAEVDEIRAALASRTNRSGRLRHDSESDPYILRGLLTCGLCGSTLSTRSNGDAASPYRTYRCLHSIPAMAKRYHAPLCSTPAMIANTRPERSGAEGIEDMVWRAVPALLDEATIRAAIEHSRQDDDSAETHAERVTFVRRTLEAKAEALNDATKRLSEATDDLDRESFTATRESLKSEIRALRASLERLEAYIPSGVSHDEEEAIVALSREMRDVLDDADPSERRELLRRLRIRGAVTPDPDGAYEIGRHRYAIAWGGVFDLGQVLGSPVQNVVMFWTTQRAGSAS